MSQAPTRDSAVDAPKRAEAADDATLVARALRGEAGAFRSIMQRHNRRLYRMARSILGNDAEAEDAVQNVYVKAFRALDTFEGASGLGTWLTRIAINEALALARSRKPELQFDSQDRPLFAGRIIPFPAGTANVDPERTLAQREIQAALERAIDALPDAFRTVLVARVLEEMSIEETAELLGLRAETVKTRLHRARLLLRTEMEKRIGPVLLDAFPFAGRRCERIGQAVLDRLGIPG